MRSLAAPPCGWPKSSSRSSAPLACCRLISCSAAERGLAAGAPVGQHDLQPLAEQAAPGVGSAPPPKPQCIDHRVFAGGHAGQRMQNADTDRCRFARAAGTAMHPVAPSSPAPATVRAAGASPCRQIHCCRLVYRAGGQPVAAIAVEAGSQLQRIGAEKADFSRRRQRRPAADTGRGTHRRCRKWGRPVRSRARWYRMHRNRLVGDRCAAPGAVRIHHSLDSRPWFAVAEDQHAGLCAPRPAPPSLLAPATSARPGSSCSRICGLNTGSAVAVTAWRIARRNCASVASSPQ